MLALFSATSAGAEQRHAGPLIYRVVEEQPAGTVIADIRRDCGLASNDTLSFSLLADKARAHFRIDAATGVLSTSKVIDREVPCSGQPVCRQTADVVVRPLMHFVKVIVEIVDLNDNSPAFPRDHVTEYVSEATLPDQLLFLIQSAYDVDGPEFGVVGYRLVGGSAATSDTFRLSVDSSPAGGFDVRLVLRQALDRERRGFYQLQVSVIQLNSNRCVVIANNDAAI